MNTRHGVGFLAGFAFVLALSWSAATTASGDSMPRPDLSLISQERLLQAVEAAQAAVADAPQSTKAWGRLGHIYLAHDWEAEAAQCYRRAAAIEPTEFRWPYFLGRSLASTDLKAASHALARALDLDATYAPAYNAQADLLRKLGRPEEARRHLERAAELDPRNPFAELGLGEIALSAKRFEAARDHLHRALALNPGQSEAHQALAQVYLALGDREAANRHARAAREPTQFRPLNDPLWDEVERAGVTWYWFAKRADRYLRAKDYERGVAEFSEAASDNERAPMFWYNYGVVLVAARRYKQAVSSFERALAALQDPHYKDKIDSGRKRKIYNNLGVASHNIGALDAAEKYFRQALALDPSSALETYNLARLYYGQGRLEDAIRLLKESQATATSLKLRQTLERLVRERGASP